MSHEDKVYRTIDSRVQSSRVQHWGTVRYDRAGFNEWTSRARYDTFEDDQRTEMTREQGRHSMKMLNKESTITRHVKSYGQVVRDENAHGAQLDCRWNQILTFGSIGLIVPYRLNAVI